MREALAIVAEQGLDSMWKRHTQLGKYLWAGLSEIGLEPYVTDPADRLITVNTIRVPKDIDAVKLITFAMAKFSLEISAGAIGVTHSSHSTHQVLFTILSLALHNLHMFAGLKGIMHMGCKLARAPTRAAKEDGQLATRTAVLHLEPR